MERLERLTYGTRRGEAHHWVSMTPGRWVGSSTDTDRQTRYLFIYKDNAMQQIPGLGPALTPLPSTPLGK